MMVVDDHPLVRKGLSALISDESHLEVCGQAESAEVACSTMAECKPDLMVIDVSLPGINGIELIKRIRSRDSKVRILVSSMHDEKLFAERCLRAGANGYIHKESATNKVLDAITLVLDGDVYLSTEMTSQLLRGAIGDKAGSKSGLDALSDRELEVFALIGDGLPTKEIAARLHLSVKTIETHRDHIRRKLDIGSSVELMRHAVQWVLENGELPHEQ